MAEQNPLPTPVDSHEIKYIKIISAGQKEYEVSHLLVNLDIYHDIDEPLAHGTLVLHSQKNILETIPLVGLELIRVSFSSLNDDGKSRTSYEKEFHIISIPDYILDKTNNTENVLIEIISKAAWDQQFINVSRSFPRATTSDVVRHMFQKMNHPIEIEDTLHSRDLICPNLTPFQFIQKLKNISISRNRNHSDYRFFERRDEHWFKSSRTLIEANPIKDYYDGIPNFYHYDNSLLLYFKKDMHVNMADQLMDGIKLNAYEHSITKKTFTTYSITDTQYEDEFPSMNPSRPILKPEFFNNLDGGVIYKTGDGIYSTDTKGKFNESLVREMGRTKIIFSQATIKIAGNANLDVGDVINLRFTDTAGEESTLNSGKWIVSQMKHTVNLSEYSQTCTIIKGSYKQITKEIQE